MKIKLIRHATLIIYVNGKKILVDPMLSPAGTYSPIEGVTNHNFNPLVELPINIEKITNCDAILLTHTHSDHFDDAAIKLLSKCLPVFCQPEDKAKLYKLGFTNVFSINSTFTWEGITFTRTAGKHGHGIIALKMAPVSGFVISSIGEPSVYIAGDTVWCKEVNNSIEKFKPEILVCNCGAAQFPIGKPITMTAEDIYKIANSFPNIKLVAVHMEAWNHCRLSRKALKCYIAKHNFSSQVSIPSDGETLIY